MQETVFKFVALFSFVSCLWFPVCWADAYCSANAAVPCCAVLCYAARRAVNTYPQSSSVALPWTPGGLCCPPTVPPSRDGRPTGLCWYSAHRWVTGAAGCTRSSLLMWLQLSVCWQPTCFHALHTTGLGVPGHWHWVVKVSSCASTGVAYADDLARAGHLTAGVRVIKESDKWLLMAQCRH